MKTESYQELRKEIEKKYFGIDYIVCPSLNNKKVYFRRVGFRHIIRKHRSLRTIGDQIRRLIYFRFVPGIVASNETISRYVGIGKSRNVHFWSLIKRINSELTLKVVIMKVSEGDLEYLSIMDL